jgi:hypothetical protein
MAAAGLALLAAGCGMFDRSVPPPCPPVLVVNDASTFNQYRPGPGRDVIDMIFQGRIADFRGGCTWSRDRTEVDLDISIAFDVERGPANPDRKGRFSYFVAIPAFHPTPQGKQVFPVDVAFPGNVTRMRAHQTVRLSVPVARNKRYDDYPVYIGFQLAPAEIEENRRRRGP